jgi:endonuclease G
MASDAKAGMEQGEAVTSLLAPGGEAAVAPGGSITVTVPLTLTIALGPPGPPAPGPTPPLPREPARTAPGAFAGRIGFDRDFLGVRVELPAIRPAPRFGGALPVPPERRSHAEDATELRYQHYSVIMNGPRRTAYLAAVNIDYAAPFRESRPNSESWALDGRLADSDQLDNRYYENNDYDRGHLAMRADCSWGMSREEAVRGNLESFHWTNGALQHKLFNQSSGRRLWGDLENHIAAQGRGQRARLSILNGPVFADDDRPMKDARVPGQYWKIIVWKDAADAAPGAVGFVLDQRDLIQDMPIEAIDPGAFSIRQKKIADIDAMLDVDLSGVVPFDRFRVTESTEAAVGDAASILIRSLADVAT